LITFSLENKFILKENMVVRTLCKINLHLGVKERRPDGFHNLESVFLPLEFGDILTFTPLEKDEVCDLRVTWRVQTPQENIPVERNIVYRAVSLFRERTGWKGGIRVALEKSVPIGAGLGGGSADAAATLKALDSLACTNLPFSVLREMAGELGSDVPFFLYNSTAFVSGRGEYVRRIESPAGLAIVLVVPNFASNTGEAFRLLDEDRLHRKARNPVVSEDALVNALKRHPSTWPYYNDFLPVFLKGAYGKEYADILTALKEEGADFCGLSGSGSCCFGVFVDKDAAASAEKAFFYKNFTQIAQLASCFLP
jgi:4-diphosphocytidyl-2-C-methyl-D-erythritol kinase